MTRRSSRFHATARWVPALVVLASLTVAIPSCAKRITTVDEAFTVPEGTFTPEAQLVVWPDVPTVLRTYEDVLPPGPNVDETCGQITPGTGDPLVASVEFRRRAPGTISGMIFDRTPGTTYQLFRRESGGGFRQFQDFMITPFRRWLTSEWELYTFVDPAPSGFQPPSYIGRGLVRGTANPRSPLTNMAESDASTIDDIGYTGICNPCDSLFTLRWRSVPAAARYWMQVYVFTRPPGALTLRQSGTAAVINDIQSRDIFLGYVDAPDTSYKLRDPLRTNVTVLIQRETNFNVTYMVRIAAVNARGRLIAYTSGDQGRVTGETTYQLFPMGAMMITPRMPPRCQQG